MDITPYFLSLSTISLLAIGVIAFRQWRKRSETFEVTSMFGDEDLKLSASPFLKELMKKSNSFGKLAQDAVLSEFGDIALDPNAMKILGLYVRVRKECSDKRMTGKSTRESRQLDLKMRIEKYIDYANTILLRSPDPQVRASISATVLEDSRRSFSDVSIEIGKFQAASPNSVQIGLLDSKGPETPSNADSFPQVKDNSANSSTPKMTPLPPNPALSKVETEFNLVTRQANGTYIVVKGLTDVVAHFKARNIPFSESYFRRYLRQTDGSEYSLETIKSAVKR